MKSIDSFNDETKQIIEQFVKDLFGILPNLDKKIDRNIIQNMVVENLDHNIEFEQDLEPGINGTYSSKEKLIKIRKGLDLDRKNCVVFHELFHALTRNSMPKVVSEYGYMREVLTTLVEKKYAEYKGLSDKVVHKNRINGYISDFGEQLYIIYGDKILENVIADPDNYNKTFESSVPYFSGGNYFNLIASEMSNLHGKIQAKVSSAVVKGLVFDLESRIMSKYFYEIMFTRKCDSFQKLNDLFESQHFPFLETYYNIINSIKIGMDAEEYQEEINKYPFLKKLDKLHEIILKNIGSKDDMNAELLKFGKENKKDSRILLMVVQKYFGYEENYELHEFFEKDSLYYVLFEYLMNSDNKYDIDIHNSNYNICTSYHDYFAQNLKGPGTHNLNFGTDIVGRIDSPQDRYLISSDERIYKKVDINELINLTKNEAVLNYFKKILKDAEANECDLSTVYLNEDDFEIIKNIDEIDEKMEQDLENAFTANIFFDTKDSDMYSYFLIYDCDDKFTYSKSKISFKSTNPKGLINNNTNADDDFGDDDFVDLDDYDDYGDIVSITK